MKNYTDYRERVMAFKAVMAQALIFESDKEMNDYLATEFTDANDLFCQFIGYCSSVFKDQAVKIPRYKLVMFMTAVAMEGLSLGWVKGFNDAKRICYPMEGVS